MKKVNRDVPINSPANYLKTKTSEPGTIKGAVS